MRYINIIFLSVVSFLASANTEFPGRDRYPHIPVIELEELYKERENIVIIDARSPYEYETLRIKNAILVPLTLSSKLFEKEMLHIAAQNPNKKLVFYCNGHSCMKSYKAVKRSRSYVGLKNVYAYDAGMFDWAQAHPDETILLESPLEDPVKLISKKDFKSHMLEGEKFIKSATKDTVILDIRDRIERDGFIFFPVKKPQSV